ncbi:MAG: hypothetical protein HYX55_03945 [Chloroflexi bacterium]|nr:hypothetical protein [Chloroflexota bacterium]
MGFAQAPGRFGTDPGFDAPRSTRSERLYAGLLRAYPRAFRSRYGEEMVVLFGDQLRDARAANGAGGVTTTWFRTLIDLASSAVGEHLRKDRTMATSLATFEPTRSMRWLGLFGVVGCVLLLFAFIRWSPFESLAVNTVRLLLFGLAGAAIAVAFHRRQASVSPRIALVATSAVVIAGAWYTAGTALGSFVENPFAGTFGFIGALAAAALFATPTLYGLAMLRIGAAWQGMSKWRAAVTRIAAVVLLGSFLGVAGNDRWGLTDDPTFGWAWSRLAVLGVFFCGAGWGLLGAVLVSGGRGARATA